MKQRMITFNGVTQLATEWARTMNVNEATMRYRLAHWPIERALTERKHNTGRPSGGGGQLVGARQGPAGVHRAKQFNFGVSGNGAD